MQSIWAACRWSWATVDGLKLRNCSTHRVVLCLDRIITLEVYQLRLGGLQVLFGLLNISILNFWAAQLENCCVNSVPNAPTSSAYCAGRRAVEHVVSVFGNTKSNWSFLAVSESPTGEHHRCIIHVWSHVLIHAAEGAAQWYVPLCCIKMPDNVSLFVPELCDVFPFSPETSRFPRAPLCHTAQCRVQNLLLKEKTEIGGDLITPTPQTRQTGLLLLSVHRYSVYFWDICLNAFKSGEHSQPLTSEGQFPVWECLLLQCILGLVVSMVCVLYTGRPEMMHIWYCIAGQI